MMRFTAQVLGITCKAAMGSPPSLPPSTWKSAEQHGAWLSTSKERSSERSGCGRHRLGGRLDERLRKSIQEFDKMLKEAPPD
jgi:hypothetical protein